jgi:outer membrane protein
MTKSALTAAFAITCCSLVTTVHADTIFGVYFGAGLSQTQYSGDIRLTGNTIDLENDFGLDKKDNSYVYIAFEHPVPVLPNVRLAQTQLLAEADSVLSRTITFNNRTYTASSAISAEVDLSFTDATFYYEVLDNWLSLDLGLTARNFDGFAKVTSNGNLNRYDFNEVLPLLYVSAEAELPFTGFSVHARLQGLSISDSSLTDSQIALAYESSIRLGGEIGYRNIAIEVDDISDLYSDLESKGVFAGVTYHF